jgi:hypothetical protein
MKMSPNAAMPPMPGQDSGFMTPTEGEPAGAVPVPGQAVTMEAIGELFRQEIGPVKQTMSNLENKVGDLRQSVDARLKDIEKRLDMTDIRVSKLESLEVPTKSPELDRLVKQMQDLESQIAAMKVGPTTGQGQGEDKAWTAVIGGLQGLSGFDEAETWIRDKLYSLWAPSPSEVYCKGDYKGVIFAKFAAQADRDEAWKTLKKAGLKEHGHDVWAKESLPIEIRAPKSLLLGLKYLFKEWGIHGARVDDMMTQLSLPGKEKVISVSVSDNKLDINWAPTWGAWKECVDSPEVLKLIDKSRQMLEGAAGKAKGKGPAGKSGY